MRFEDLRALVIVVRARGCTLANTAVVGQFRAQGGKDKWFGLVVKAETEAEHRSIRSKCSTGRAASL